MNLKKKQHPNHTKRTHRASDNDLIWVRWRCLDHTSFHYYYEMIKTRSIFIWFSLSLSLGKAFKFWRLPKMSLAHSQSNAKKRKKKTNCDKRWLNWWLFWKWIETNRTRQNHCNKNSKEKKKMVVEKNLGSSCYCLIDDLIDIVIIIKSVKTELIWTIHVVNTDRHMCIHIAKKKCVYLI